MHFATNMVGGLILFTAALAAILVAGTLADGEPAVVQRTFPYFFAALLAAPDLCFRCYAWRKIVTREKAGTLLTREGIKQAPPQFLKGTLEALFSSDAGGQYFHIIPSWIAGLGVAATSFFNGWHWIGDLLRTNVV